MFSKPLIFVIILALKKSVIANLSRNKVTFPLYGSIYTTAYWFVDLYFGTKSPQRVSLIVDTGSSVLGFPCSTCGFDCGQHIDNPYELTEATQRIACQRGCILCAYEDEQRTQGNLGSDVCAYHIEYIEGSSLTGRWYQDELIIKNRQKTDSSEIILDESVKIPIGCHSEETHQFKKQLALGILGLEIDSHFGPPTFVSSILTELLNRTELNQNTFETSMQRLRFHTVPQSSLIQPEFAICLSRNGGSLTIGGDHSEYHVVKGFNRELAEDKFTTDMIGNPVNSFTASIESFIKNAWSQISTLLAIANDYLSGGRALRKVSQFYMPIFDQNNKSSTHQSSRHILLGNTSNDPASKIQWTPMVAFIDQNGQYDTYMILLEKWMILPSPKNQTGQASNLILPPISIPPYMNDNYYFMTPLRVKTGLLCLVDSGTTLTHLPLSLYIQFWIEFNKQLLKTTTVQHYDSTLDSRQSTVRRVSGESIDSLHKKAIDKLDSLQNNAEVTSIDEIEINLEQIHQIQYAMDLLEAFSSSSHDTVSNVSESLKELQESKKQTLRSWGDFDELQIQKDGLMPKRLLGQSINPAPSHEECWKLVNLEKDFRYFPKLLLKFSEKVEVTWSPEAYLYRRGKSNFYCLTITSKPDKPNNEHKLDNTNSRRKRRLQHEQDASIILGSSFFINHDLIFHVGTWSLGIADAICPQTNLSERLKSR